jgi:voltage-gated potassium channel Kch
MPMLAPLVISALIATVTIAVHMTGLGVLMAVMRSRSRHIRPLENTWRQAAFIILIVLGLFVIHAIEIWSYAGLYLILGIFQDLETALYFSTSTFTTLGYGDVIIDTQWRLVAAIEGVNGFLLLGWSTAFLVTIIGRLRAVEFDWLDRLGDDD